MVYAPHVKLIEQATPLIEEDRRIKGELKCRKVTNFSILLLTAATSVVAAIYLTKVFIIAAAICSLASLCFLCHTLRKNRETKKEITALETKKVALLEEALDLPSKSDQVKENSDETKQFFMRSGKELFQVINLSKKYVPGVTVTSFLQHMLKTAQSVSLKAKVNREIHALDQHIIKLPVIPLNKVKLEGLKKSFMEMDMELAFPGATNVNEDKLFQTFQSKVIEQSKVANKTVLSIELVATIKSFCNHPRFTYDDIEFVRSESPVTDDMEVQIIAEIIGR